MAQKEKRDSSTVLLRNKGITWGNKFPWKANKPKKTSPKHSDVFTLHPQLEQCGNCNHATMRVGNNLQLSYQTLVCWCWVTFQSISYWACLWLGTSLFSVENVFISRILDIECWSWKGISRVLYQPSPAERNFLKAVASWILLLVLLTSLDVCSKLHFFKSSFVS